jgi:hypothetical protein
MKITTHNKSFLASITFLCITFFSFPVSAQWSLSLPPPIQTATYFANDNIGREIAEEAGRKDRARRGNSNSSYTPPRPVISTASLNFTPNMQRRKRTFDILLAQFDQAQPGVSTEMRPMLFGNGDGDIIQKIHSQIYSKYKLSNNNLADAYTIYWISAWEGANGIFDSETPPAQMKAVRAQVTSAFTSIPAIAKASDADKQAYAEVLLVQAAIIGTFGEHIKADPANMPKVKKSVRAGAKALGVDVETFDLTPTGFELAKGKKRSDASDVAGEEQALASNDAAAPTPSDDSEGWSTAQIALIAAAGGAGIAGVFAIGKASGKKG